MPKSDSLRTVVGGSGHGRCGLDGDIDWRAALGELKRHLAPALGRAETRASGDAFIEGLLSGAERKTGWMLAEVAGLDRPYWIQSLLGRSAWSAEALRVLV